VAAIIERYGMASTPIRAVMLSRLGPNVWHEMPSDAMSMLEELEETARLSTLMPAARPPGRWPKNPSKNCVAPSAHAGDPEKLPLR
jgi:hypothetical protein